MYEMDYFSHESRLLFKTINSPMPVWHLQSSFHRICLKDKKGSDPRWVELGLQDYKPTLEHKWSPEFIFPLHFHGKGVTQM